MLRAFFEALVDSHSARRFLIPSGAVHLPEIRLAQCFILIRNLQGIFLMDDFISHVSCFSFSGLFLSRKEVPQLHTTQAPGVAAEES